MTSSTLRQQNAWIGMLAFAACVVTAAIPSTAQSIWQKQSCSNQKAFFFDDTQALNVGDILTVLILESTDVENRDQRSMERDANNTGSFDFVGALSGKFGNKEGAVTAESDTASAADFGGRSQYSVERGFNDRITVTVVERLPNGNLAIRGRRNRTVTGERRALAVSGVIRPIDIRADNSIESQFIADFQVCYDGDGIESRFTDQGWLTRAWNKFRPL